MIQFEILIEFHLFFIIIKDHCWIYFDDKNKVKNIIIPSLSHSLERVLLLELFEEEIQPNLSYYLLA